MMAHRMRRTRGMSARRVVGLVAIVGVLAFVAIRWPAGTDPAVASPGAPSPGSPTPSAAPSATANSAAEATPSATALDSQPPSPSPTSPPSTSGRPAADRFGLGLLIADRGNGRLLVVNDAKRILWRFPIASSLPRGQRFAADDAFIAPDGQTIVANDEQHQVIERIDIASRRVVWQYGHYDRPGSGPGYLHTPDDAYPLADGDIVVADIRNCRVLQINPSKQIVRRWGRTGSCSHRPPFTFDLPNGDTPLPDGGLLITEIGGSRVVRLSPTGKVIFDIHVPARYPSDAQLDAAGDVLVVDYSDPGAILRISPTGRILWRYRPVGGPGRLNHPSLAIPLPDGTVALNDDFRARVIVVDPSTNRIVWQYGHTDGPGRTPNHLFIPDGIDLIPAGTHL